MKSIACIRAKFSPFNFRNFYIFGILIKFNGFSLKLLPLTSAATCPVKIVAYINQRNHISFHHFNGVSNFHFNNAILSFPLTSIAMQKGRSKYASHSPAFAINLNTFQGKILKLESGLLLKLKKSWIKRESEYRFKVANDFLELSIWLHFKARSTFDENHKLLFLCRNIWNWIVPWEYK